MILKMKKNGVESPRNDRPLDYLYMVTLFSYWDIRNHGDFQESLSLVLH